MNRQRLVDLGFEYNRYCALYLLAYHEIPIVSYITYCFTIWAVIAKTIIPVLLVARNVGANHW
jgi:hypothetical protein